MNFNSYINEKSIIDLIQSGEEFEKIPLSDLPYAMTITKVTDLNSGLKTCISPKTKVLRHQYLKNSPGNNETSEDLIVKIISNKLIT